MFQGSDQSNYFVETLIVLELVKLIPYKFLEASTFLFKFKTKMSFVFELVNNSTRDISKNNNKVKKLVKLKRYHDLLVFFFKTYQNQ